MELVFTSIIAFASTNIDDIFLLMLFFGNKNFKESNIVIGQLLGIAALITMSLVISLIGLVVRAEYVGLLGLIPIYLGIKSLIGVFKNSEEDSDGEAKIEQKSNRNNVFTVSGVTIANGGDNIGIYVPIFATLTWPHKFTMITIFLLMTLLWCALAKYFTKHPLVAKAIDKYGHIVTPFVLIALGIYILYESHSLNLLF